MSDDFTETILDSTGASALSEVGIIQELWSGYGSIKRYRLEGSTMPTVIVKHVCLPERQKHPRGWDTDYSHKRKIRSYEVEKAWYRNLAAQCSEGCRIPKCYAIKTRKNESLIVLEDLDAAGFERRKQSITPNEMSVCLMWLANFHANFLGVRPENLWKIGTYWHLATREDEWKALKDTALKDAAHMIDRKLQEAGFQTLVHGDAKLANFCFSGDGSRVAAVDFQYVGGGCGMKDVAYFIGSCLNERDSEVWEKRLLEVYFNALERALKSKHPTIDADALITEWRELFPVAWADFHRFIKGWSPGHWKINSYSEQICRKVLSEL